MRLLIKYATRSRPHLLRSTLALYRAYLDRPDLARVVVTLDRDDPTLAHALEILDGLPGVTTVVGDSTSKVSAINADIPQDDSWDVLLVASDDMIPQVKGYDRIIREEMQRHYPDLDGALHFNDGRRGDLWTLTVMGKKFYDRFGYVYHPDYESLFCDNEAMQVAQSLRRLAYVDQVIIHHQWRMVTGDNDVLYERNDSPEMYALDGETFRRRRAMGFPTARTEENGTK